MEKRGYLAFVLREANEFVNAHGTGVGKALVESEPSDELRLRLESQLAGSLVEVDHLEDVLKHSSLREIDPSLWRTASRWESVLTSAALAALVHDVRGCARDIVEGRTPRMDNVQAR